MKIVSFGPVFYPKSRNTILLRVENGRL